MAKNVWKKMPERKKLIFTVGQLVAKTMTKAEAKTLGLTEVNLFPVFERVGSIKDYSVSVQDVKSRETPFLDEVMIMNRGDLVAMSREMKQSDVLAAVTSMAAGKRQIDWRMLERKKITREKLLPLAMSSLVLSKIKLCENDLVKLGVGDYFARGCDRRWIGITLRYVSDKDGILKPEKCPLSVYCNRCLNAISENRIDNFSCDNCGIYKFIVERMKHADNRDPTDFLSMNSSLSNTSDMT
ncbi:hypothetical protein C0584_01855 [Candidatus Parcubacteria bacterium]|mgnify:CR=1 FL=1|nr:MAG: hypothetical protein C0584_01855 [Candidatus Parcubacteria bacterium]